MCRFIHKIWQLVKIFFMNKNFDSTVNHIQQTKYWTTILSGFIFASNFVVGKSLATEVAGVLEDTSLEPGSRLAHLNQVKMLCYLLCQYMEMFEDDSNEKSDVITTGKVNNDLFYRKSVHLWRNRVICLLIVFRVERTRNQLTWLLTGRWREKTESRHCFTWSRWIFWGSGIHQSQK